MKLKIIFILFLAANMACCQTVSYDKKIVEETSTISILEAPLMIEEILEIYSNDSTIISKSFDKNIYDRTEYTLYCYNVCIDTFKQRLTSKSKYQNIKIAKSINSDIDFDQNYVKPKINWGKVFETCSDCPFGAYPDDRFFYFWFSVMYMGEHEIMEMIEIENGKQWKYALMAIKGGDSFTLDDEGNHKQYILDRRMANYVIERWDESQITEVQNLVRTLKDVID